MVDVGRVKGPEESPDKASKKDKIPEDGKFKKLMVEKVGEVNPDQKRNRKRRGQGGAPGEDEEEEGIEGIIGPTTPLSEVKPFFLEKEGKSIASPMEIQSTGNKISPLSTANPSSTNPEGKSAAFVSSPPDQPEDTGTWDEDSFMEQPPTTQQPQTQPSLQQPPLGPPSTSEEGTAPLPEQRAPTLPASGKGAPTTPPQSAQQGQPAKAASKEAFLPPGLKKTTAAPTKKGVTSPKATEKPAPKEISGQPKSPTAAKKDTPKEELSPTQKRVVPTANPTAHKGVSQEESSASLPKEGAAPREAPPTARKEDTEAFFKQLGGQTAERPAPSEEQEVEAAETIEGLPLPPTQPLSSTSISSGKEMIQPKKEEYTPIETPETPETQLVPGIVPVIEPTPMPSYATFSPQVFDLFERMAGVMTVMTMSGVTETTFTLNAPQFASSVFYGAQIIIQEFSTAPKAFNVQILATPQGMQAFEGKTDDLMAAFQAGSYNFRVNRLDTGILKTERPLFHRKEGSGGKEMGKEGETR